VDQAKHDERQKDQQRKAKKRAAERDIIIPAPANVARRLEAEADPIRWLSTYFASKVSEDWTEDRLAMVRSIIDAAMYGGDQAIAGPRGEGKTTLAMLTALYLMFLGLSCFPVVIGKNADKAIKEKKDLVEQLQQNELLLADYPEVCVPFQSVGAWASTARKQTCGGIPTNIALGPEFFAFPQIEADQIAGWPEGLQPASRGQVLYCLGVDGAVRGTKHKSLRPTIAIIDDIEDREAAASDTQIAKNEEIIEQDIAGLGASAERISRVMLCTTQNRKCIAYRYTDPAQKPSWRGKRYRKMVCPPDNMAMVEEYIERRRMRSKDDPDAREAFRFWKDSQASIEAGAVVSNKNSYSRKMHKDGEPLELSAIHAYYNRVADNGQKSVSTEIDNDPPEETGPQGQGLTAELVASRLSGLGKRQIPLGTIALTAAIDLGKYMCHWVAIAWLEGGAGCVVDYGVAEVANTSKSLDNEASQPMIYRALLNWRDELLAKEFVDGAGGSRQVDFVLVDSGTFTDAAYEFCRQTGGKFHPSKGLANYRQRKASSDDTIAGEHLHAQRFRSSQIWLYELDTDHWKRFAHERFLTPTFDENNMLRRGSLSLYSLDGNRKHNTFAQHIAAEELVTEFKEGKGAKTYWRVLKDNNHWLDATYMACAAGDVCGVRLISPSETEVQPRVQTATESKARSGNKPQHGRFRQRPGGWVPRRRR
jgi:hypothetical protein